MKNLKCSIFALVLILVFAGLTNANPNDEMKTSPLYKASLENSISRLENAETQSLNTNGGNLIETSQPGCEGPDAPLTYMPTCSPTACGSNTCESTCVGYPTCYSTCLNTCQSTCWNTCVSTCANTCVPGSCQRYNFSGTSYWVYYPYYSNNWGLVIQYTPYALYQNNPGGVLCQFDGEGFPGTSISAVALSTGSYSGNRVRTTTSIGAYLNHAVIIWVDEIHTAQRVGTTHLNGPLTTHPNTNYANIYVWL